MEPAPRLGLFPENRTGRTRGGFAKINEQISRPRHFLHRRAISSLTALLSHMGIWAQDDGQAQQSSPQFQMLAPPQDI